MSQAEHHMLLTFPGEGTASTASQPPAGAELSLHSLGLSNEMQSNQPGPSMLNLWTMSANVPLEKASVVSPWFLSGNVQPRNRC